MSWVLKHKYSFNKYIGEDLSTVMNIANAKQYRTKKEAGEDKKKIEAPLEILKVIKNK